MTPAPRSRSLVPILIFIDTVVAVISSLGAPLVPAIASWTGASSSDSSGYARIAGIGLVVCLATDAATWFIPGRAVAPQPAGAARAPEPVVDRG